MTSEHTAATEPDDKTKQKGVDSCTNEMDSTFSETLEESLSTTSEYESTVLDYVEIRLNGIEFLTQVRGSFPLMPPPTTPTKQRKNRKTSRGLQTPPSNNDSNEASSQSSPSPPCLKLKSHNPLLLAKKKPARAPIKSPFFSSPPPSAEKPKTTIPREKRPRQIGATISCIPFPPLSNPSFGLLQEKLSSDPFRLLIGVTFLNRTVGKYAIPVFFSLIKKYPTPADILAAEAEDIISVTRHLGLQAQRAETYKKFAHFWIHDPPVKGRRYRVDHYPSPSDGMDIKANEVLDDADPRSAWEIGHMTQGRYAIDSWRIFCRDMLRGEAQDWNGEGRDGSFQPEWMRVLPRDKELVACLRWMWLKEGFSWDPVTGEKEVADRELMDAAIAGKIAWDDLGGMRVLNCNDVEDNDVGKVEDGPVKAIVTNS